jgi:hypothetical protein
MGLSVDVAESSGIYAVLNRLSSIPDSEPNLDLFTLLPFSP